MNVCLYNCDQSPNEITSWNPCREWAIGRYCPISLKIGLLNSPGKVPPHVANWSTSSVTAMNFPATPNTVTSIKIKVINVKDTITLDNKNIGTLATCSLK